MIACNLRCVAGRCVLERTRTLSLTGKCTRAQRSHWVRPPRCLFVGPLMQPPDPNTGQHYPVDRRQIKEAVSVARSVRVLVYVGAVCVRVVRRVWHCVWQ